VNALRFIPKVFLFLFLFSVKTTMANETYDSSKGHIVLPVLHPSGDLHNISIAEDTPIADLHSALASEYSHPAIEVHEKQRTADDALENSDSFRKTAASL
jgi:hypothetical protein